MKRLVSFEGKKNPHGHGRSSNHYHYILSDSQQILLLQLLANLRNRCHSLLKTDIIFSRMSLLFACWPLINSYHH